MVKVSGVPYDVELPLSPCTKVCKLDETKSYCIACFRFKQEIASWRDYTMEQRAMITALTETRRIMYESNKHINKSK